MAQEQGLGLGQGLGQSSHISALDGGRADAGRLGWLDAARGVGIFLVVFGHVWRGLVAPDILSDPALFGAVDRFVYLFHMPVFFLLSGYVFLGGRWAGPVPFVAQKFTRLLWPAMLWFYLFVAANIAVGSATNTLFPMSKLLGWPQFGGTYLWFLWALFLIQMAAIGLKAAPKAWRLWAVAGGALLALGVRYGGMDLPVSLIPALTYAPVFLAGVALALLSRDRQGSIWGALPVGLAGAGLFILAQGLAAGSPGPGPGHGLVHVALGLGAAFGVTAAIYGVWAWAPRSAVMRRICALGQASMAVYLLHVFFTAGTRIALLKIGVTALVPHVLLGVALGLLAPLGVLALARRFNLVRVLGF